MANITAQIKQKTGNTINNINPLTTAGNVSVTTTNTDLPSGVSDVQDVVDELKSMAFNDGNNIVYLTDTPDQTYDPTVIDYIDDAHTTAYSTWSSSKINSLTSVAVYISSTPDAEDPAYSV